MHDTNASHLEDDISEHFFNQDRDSPDFNRHTTSGADEEDDSDRRHKQGAFAESVIK